MSAARITRSASPRLRAFGSLVRAILHLRLEDGLVAQAYKLLGELVVSHEPRAGLAGVLLGRLGIDLLSDATTSLTSFLLSFLDLSNKKN